MNKTSNGLIDELGSVAVKDMPEKLDGRVIKNGYIVDYVSGIEVKATPEEIEAVQVFSKQLVEDYGYPKSHIQTRPQFRVKARPSGQKEFPVDIAVFEESNKNDTEVYIIIECKQKNRKDGLDQLQDYLRFSRAKLGVWFNGSERLFLRKYEKNDQIIFEEIPNIPRYGQRLEDVGFFKRADLKPTHNLKEVFRSIRNYLAGNAVGTTRDEEFARQMINLILCKLYDEKYTKSGDIVKFRAGVGENIDDVASRVQQRFTEAKQAYSDVLSADDTISLDHKSLTYVVGELQNYSLIDAKRDVIGDAFEIFIGRALKGGQGQFFTPRNVVNTAIKILDPQIDDKIIDPACGSGGFLTECLRYIHTKIEKIGEEYNWPEKEINAEKIAKINLNLRGIEKDSFLSKVAKAYMVVMGDGKSGIYCEDSLDKPENWNEKTRENIQLGTFDIVVTNPPFGAKIPVKGTEKLAQYEFGYKWKKDESGRWVQGKLEDQQSPQILFIDRCFQLLKEGGKMGIVLPDGALSNPTDGYIMQSILDRSEIIGMIDMPMSTFLPYTPTKTHLLFVRKKKNPSRDYTFFMSYAKSCGHDRRGKSTGSDEIIEIPKHLNDLACGKEESHLGFTMNYKRLKNDILLPKYYNPDIDRELKRYQESGQFEIKSFADLVEEHIIKIKRGNEVGSEYYGTGDIPFIRTSEVSNWEITADPTHCISEEIYNKYKSTQNIQEEEILVVNDGTYLMGRSAMITDIDLKIVIQSHFRKITVLNKDKLSPYLLLSIMGLEVVQKQIEAKSFRQGTISTLGNRILEVKLPIPIDNNIRDNLHNIAFKAIQDKKRAKLSSQNFWLHNKKENLMGIPNKARLGNLL